MKASLIESWLESGMANVTPSRQLLITVFFSSSLTDARPPRP